MYFLAENQDIPKNLFPYSMKNRKKLIFIDAQFTYDQCYNSSSPRSVRLGISWLFKITSLGSGFTWAGSLIIKIDNKYLIAR